MNIAVRDNTGYVDTYDPDYELTVNDGTLTVTTADGQTALRPRFTVDAKGELVDESSEPAIYEPGEWVHVAINA